MMAAAASGFAAAKARVNDNIGGEEREEPGSFGTLAENTFVNTRGASSK